MLLSMKMFMSLMLLVGIILTIYAFRINNVIKNCPMKVQNAARGLVVLGVLLISISGTYMVCGCSKTLSNSTLGISFVVLMLFMGIIVITLTSIIHSSCKPARKSTPVLLSLAVITTVMSSGYLYSTVFGKKTSYQPLKTDMTAQF